MTTTTTTTTMMFFFFISFLFFGKIIQQNEIPAGGQKWKIVADSLNDAVHGGMNNVIGDAHAHPLVHPPDVFSFILLTGTPLIIFIFIFIMCIKLGEGGGEGKK